MNAEEVSRFEQVNAQLSGLYTEISTLSKKSPDDAINKFKLGFVNKLLVVANGLLGEERRPFSDFEVFDETDLPANSDIVMMLSQYLNCLEKLRADNISPDGFSLRNWYWVIDGDVSSIRTSPPKKIK